MSIKHYFYAALFILITQGCISQTAAPYVYSSAGATKANDSGEISWTIGEPLIETGSAGDNVITQGFQQPANLIVTSEDNPVDKSVTVSAYPNPVSGILYVQSSSSQTLFVEIQNLEGQIILKKQINGKDNSINTEGLPNGIFLLKAYDKSNNLIRVVKIDKIK